MFCVNFITQVFEIIHFSAPPVRFVGEEFLGQSRFVSFYALVTSPAL